MVLNNWKVDRKAYNDKVQRERRKSLGTKAQPSDIVEHSGVLTDRLRMMTEVQTSPLLVDHTFPDKELLLLRIAEEVNLSGCWVSCKRSDDYRVQIYGSDSSSSFCVKAVFSTSTGWKVTTAETREITLPQESDSYEDVATEPDHGLEGVDENDDDHADGVMGDADGDADGVIMSVAKGNRNRSPMKSRWIFPLIKEVIAKAPNLSNREMKNILSDYIKVKFQSTSLLQNARTFATMEVFGDPGNNVLFLNGLVQKMKEGGHHVVVVIKEHSEVMKMLERVVLSEEMERKKAAKKLMTKAEKISNVTNWKAKNRKMLIEGGVWPPMGGDQVILNPRKFLSGIFLLHRMHRERFPIFRRYFKLMPVT
mgnify:CR=1 FL=1